MAQTTTSGVRERRVAAGISGVAMAEYMGMQVSVYYKKETGDIKWSLEEAQRVAEFFGESIEAIFCAK